MTRTTSCKNAVRIIPLGGLDGIGKNMTVIEHADDMILIDAGLMFPDDDHPGVDLILPDYSYVLENKDRLRGIVITHGHEDHTGALPYLLKDLGAPVPVLGTRLTLGLVKGKLEEHRITKAKLREVRDNSHVTLGTFGIDFFPVNHSIPDGVGLFVRTPVATILHTGDFKLDQTPIDGRLTDYAALTKFGRLGVTVLLSDSTGAENAGICRSEAEVGTALREIISRAEKRVIVASFASHIHRLQQVCNAAVAAGRKVVITGRSMIQNVRIARELGYLDVDEAHLVDSYESHGLAPHEAVVLCTGSQGEPLSALARMANGDHRTIQIERGDTVIISASPVPGNEKAVSRVINRLTKAGAHVIHRATADVHVSGHAYAEELKLMLNLTQPEFFVPIHGETRHLAAHARLAQAVGLPEEAIFILENGDCLEVDEEEARVSERVEAGVVYVDGLTVGDLSQVVLRDRQHMSQDGIVTAVVAIDGATGALSGDPEVVPRGLVLADPTALLEEARARVAKVVARTAAEGATDTSVVQRRIREALSQLIWERTKRRPLVLPIVLEV